MAAPANYPNFRDKKHERRVQFFRQARLVAPAFNRARGLSKDLKVWDPSQRGFDWEAKTAGSRVRRLEDIASSFATCQAGSLDHLANERFSVNYNVYGDLDREPVYGENTNSIGVDVKWEVEELKVNLVPGNLKSIMMHEDLVAVARRGLQSRESLSKATGWSRQGLYALPPDSINNLASIIGSAVGGYSKLTRLVKGFLVYLHALEDGPLNLDVLPLRAVEFSEANIAQEARVADQAYIYNSLPQFHVHEAMLAIMCNQYPPPGLGCHLTIPADAPKSIMIGRGAMSTTLMRPRLTAELVYAAVNRYALDTDCVSELQPALMIAMSLKQNRYFTHASLPKVVSFCDLMAPCIVHNGKAETRANLTAPMSIAVGRLHQMVSFATVKDLATAAEMSASGSVSAMSHIIDYLLGNEQVVRLNGARLSSVPVVGGTEELNYLDSIVDHDVEGILGTSILEVLWLCTDSDLVCTNGVFHVLKRGSNDVEASGDSMAALEEEMREAGISFRGYSLPQGSFLVEGVSLGSAHKSALPVYHWESVDIKRTHPCDTKFPRSVVRRRRVPERAPSPSDIASPPPRYATRREHSSTPEVPSEQAERPETREGTESLFSLEAEEVETLSPQGQRVYKDIRQQLAEEAAGGEGPAVAVPAGAGLPQAKRRSWLDDDFLQMCGVVPGMDRQSVVEKIMSRRYKVPTPPENIWGAYGFDIVAAMGYGLEDADVVLTAFAERKLLGRLWLDGDIRKLGRSLGERGAGLLDYTPHNAQTVELFDAAGLTEVTSLAKREKRNWKGDLTALPRSAWKQVANSRPMEEMLLDHGVSLDHTAFGKKAGYAVIDFLVSSPDYRIEWIPKLMPWVEGTSINPFRTNLAEPLPAFPIEVEVLEFRDRPGSMIPREYNAEDSKYLFLAAQCGQKIVPYGVVDKLVHVFSVPGQLISELKRRKYLRDYEQSPTILPRLL